MLPAEFHPAANREADEAFRWYRTRDPAAAQRFKGELSRLIDLMRQRPQMFPPYLAGTRRGVVSGFPYLLMYLDRPDRIRIVAVAHGSRRPGYWRRRVSPP